jgi:hypothetical protein
VLVVVAFLVVLTASAVAGFLILNGNKNSYAIATSAAVFVGEDREIVDIMKNDNNDTADFTFHEDEGGIIDLEELLFWVDEDTVEPTIEQTDATFKPTEASTEFTASPTFKPIESTASPTSTPTLSPVSPAPSARETNEFTPDSNTTLCPIG